jgi:hypothetical protein
MNFATRLRIAYSISTYSVFVKMCGIFYNTPTMSLSTVTMTRCFTLIHMWERRTILCAKSKLLYSEIALPQKPFRIGYMYIHTFLLRMTDTMTFQNTDLSSWDTLYSRSILMCLSDHLTYNLLNSPQHTAYFNPRIMLFWNISICLQDYIVSQAKDHGMGNHCCENLWIYMFFNFRSQFWSETDTFFGMAHCLIRNII